MTRGRPSRLSTYLALLPLVLLPAPPAAGRSPSVDRDVSHFRLPNGLDVVVAVRPELGLAAVNLTVAVGSIDDPEEQSGMAHLLEHVTLSGSVRIGSLDPGAEAAALDEVDRAFAALASERRRPEPRPQVVSRLEKEFEAAQAAASRTAEVGEILGHRLEERGAIGLNATTTADATQFFAWLPQDALELWISLEAQRLRQPIFRRFYRERGVMLREVASLTGGRPTLQERFWAQMLEPAQEPQPLAGDPDEIVAIDRPAALAYFRRVYRPENVAIAVVGDVDPPELYRLVVRHFGDWRPPEPSPYAPAPGSSDPHLGEPRVGSFNSVRSPVVYLAFPQPPVDAGASAVWDAVAELINSPELSPLQRQMVTGGGLAWSVGASPRVPSEKRDSVFLVHVYGTGRASHRALIEQTAGLLEGLGRLPAADLEGAILGAEMRLAAEMDDSPTLASLLAFHQAVHDDWRVPFRRLEDLQRLELDDLRAAVRQLVGGLDSAIAREGEE